MVTLITRSPLGFPSSILAIAANIDLREWDKESRGKDVTLNDDDEAGVWGGGRLIEKGQREASALSKFKLYPDTRSQI